MVTLSGSTDFNQTRNEIISDALTLLGAIEQGESPNADDNEYAIRQLERMVKHWQGQGIHLWSRREATLFITPSQAAYELGPSSADHAAEDNDIARTTLSADEASGQTVISITSTTDGLVTMLASDKVGIVLDDDTIHWTTIATVDSTTQITITVATTGAASSGNFVYAFTNDLGRPLRIVDARRRDESADQDTPILIQSHQEYQRLPNKTEDGETNIIYYHPEHRNSRGTIYLWPRLDTVARTIRISCLLSLQDFDASGNNADLPTEWLDAIVWNLAKRLIPKYGVSGSASAQEIKVGGTTMLDEMLGWDQETVSVYFGAQMSHNWAD